MTATEDVHWPGDVSGYLATTTACQRWITSSLIADHCLAQINIIQSDLVTTTPLVPSKKVTVSCVSLYRCSAMYCQDRACPPTICHCDLDVTVSKVTITRSDCIANQCRHASGPKDIIRSCATRSLGLTCDSLLPFSCLTQVRTELQYWLITNRGCIRC